MVIPETWPEKQGTGFVAMAKKRNVGDFGQLFEKGFDANQCMHLHHSMHTLIYLFTYLADPESIMQEGKYNAI